MTAHFEVKTVREKKVLIVCNNGQEQSESVSVSTKRAEQVAA